MVHAEPGFTLNATCAGGPPQGCPFIRYFSGTVAGWYVAVFCSGILVETWLGDKRCHICTKAFGRSSRWHLVMVASARLRACIYIVSHRTTVAAQKRWHVCQRTPTRTYRWNCISAAIKLYCRRTVFQWFASRVLSTVRRSVRLLKLESSEARTCCLCRACMQSWVHVRPQRRSSHACAETARFSRWCAG